MGTMRFEVAVPLDDDGFLDRACPSPQCGRTFKVLHRDWEQSPALAVYCPFCRWEDEPTNFTTTEQQDYLNSELEAKMAEVTQSLLGGFAKQVKRRRDRRSPISINVTTKFADIPVPVSPEALESMLLRINCENCGCTYAVVGAGFFCPLCGANSARHTFRQSVAKSRTAIQVARQLDDVLGDADKAAEARRSLLESQMGDLVTAFQRFAAELYPLLPNSPGSAKRNLFQRLADASKEWAKAGGRTFDAVLDACEWEDIKCYFLQRHLFAHTEGIVDQEYVDKSGDTIYRVGQRLSISDAHILRLAELVEKLGLGLADDLPSTVPDVIEKPKEANFPVFPRKMPGVTDNDWQVYQRVCETAVRADHESLGGETVWQLIASDGMSAQDFEESLEILESKSLVKLYRVVDSGHVPLRISLTQRGLEVFFAHTMASYQAERKRVASTLLEGASSSDVIMEKTGLSKLFVHHVLRDFESRRWVGKVLWTGGIGIVALNSEAHLKRFVGE